MFCASADAAQADTEYRTVIRCVERQCPGLKGTAALNSVVRTAGDDHSELTGKLSPNPAKPTLLHRIRQAHLKALYIS